MTEYVRDVAAELETQLPEILSTVERVVNIDSGTYDKEGVNAVMDVWGQVLADAGFAISRAPLPEHGDRLTATREFGPGAHVLVLGHADTVWPRGTVADWPYSRSGDRITGPGIGDMKAHVTMGIYALRSLLRRPIPGLGRVTYLIVPDEEIGSPGSRGWIAEVARTADVCLTLERTHPEGGVVVGRSAVGSAQIRATGVTAHCGIARQDGANAIAVLAALVPEIEALGEPERGFGAMVGMFHGGTARQVVPDLAEMSVDLRAPNAEFGNAVLAKLQDIVARPPADPRVTITMTGKMNGPGHTPFPGADELYALVEENAKLLGAPVYRFQSRAGSDANVAAETGVPTLDGLGAIAHDTCSRRETVEVASMPARGAIFAGLVVAAAQGRMPKRT